MAYEQLNYNILLLLVFIPTICFCGIQYKKEEVQKSTFSIKHLRKGNFVPLSSGEAQSSMKDAFVEEENLDCFQNCFPT